MPDFPFYFEGNTVGHLKVDRDGLGYIISAECEVPQQKGEYQAYAVAGGIEGVRLPIGVMSRVDDMLVARRKVSRAELASSGLLADLIDCGLAQAFEVEKVSRRVSPADTSGDDEWLPAENPESLVNDPPIKECLKNAESVVYRNSRDSVIIAAPISSNKPFALSPAFTIVKIIRIGQQYFGALKTDKRGNLQY